MRIAITGGTGRIGRAVVDYALREGHEVVSIDRVEPPQDVARPDVRFVRVDIANYDDMEAALRGCDALVHLAAIPGPWRHPDHVVHNNNVAGSYNALRAAAEVGIERVCQASSTNAIGGAYSRWPRYDYFPLDEEHPTYNEGPYSLSKWICELQGDPFARRYEGMVIASLRFHGVTPRRPEPRPGLGEPNVAAKHLWAYTLLDATARSCLQSLTADFRGHEAFYIVAPETMMQTPSIELARHYFPEVPIRGDLDGNRGFFNCAKAEQLLGWKHDD